MLEPLIEGVGNALKDGGLFLVEIDPRQAETVMNLCRKAGLIRVSVLHDLAGRARAVRASGRTGEEAKPKEHTD